MLEINKVLKEYICPVCGNHFIPAPYHRYAFYYQNVKIVCCRYNCYVKAQKARDEAEQKNQQIGIEKRKITCQNKLKENNEK